MKKFEIVLIAFSVVFLCFAEVRGADKFNVNPGSISFGNNVLQGTTVSRTFQVEHLAGPSLQVNISVSEPYTASLPSFTLNRNDKRDVTVTLISSAAPLGVVTRTIEVTAGNQTKTVIATVTIVAPGRIDVSPTSIDFGFVFNSTNLTRTFQVTRTAGISVPITINVNSPFLVGPGTFTLGTNETRIVTVTIPQGTPAGSHTGAVQVTAPDDSKTVALRVQLIEK